MKKEFGHLPQTPKILEKILEQKNLVFDHCIKAEIMEAQQDLNISKIKVIEKTVEKYLGGTPGIKNYRNIIRRAKDHGIQDVM